jgi:hypothetical protein
MRIYDYSHHKLGDDHVLRARVGWEDCDRGVDDICFRYRAPEDYLLPDNLHPFLVAAVVPALRRGERRISVEGAVCPWLRDRLTTFMAYLAHWHWYKYGRQRTDRRVPLIEAADRPHQPSTVPETGCFFSGGVDSLWTIRRNRLTIPLDHPGSIKDAIFVHGFDLGFRPKHGTDEQYFEFLVDSMREVVIHAGLRLIPVYTNLRTMEPSADCWLDEYMGSAMAAVAHGLAGHLSDVLIASSYDIAKLHPFGSHPVLEPQLGSYGLRVHHDGERHSRIEKLRAIADWPAALQCLRVCLAGDGTKLNCGRCSKCVRTKLELLCAGKLGDATTLAGDTPTVSMVRESLGVGVETLDYVDEIIAGLRRAGRKDLAEAVRRKKWTYLMRKAWDLKKLTKVVDRTVFNGRLGSGLRILRAQRAPR